MTSFGNQNLKFLPISIISIFHVEHENSFVTWEHFCLICRKILESMSPCEVWYNQTLHFKQKSVDYLYDLNYEFY